MHIRNAVSRLAAAVAVALLLAGPARADDQTVKIAKDEKGSHLTDAKGMTLYLFKKDSAGKSACAGPCVAKWPIFYGEKVDAMGGLEKKDFGTISRDDGKKQTTYKGMPLYYFAGDKAPGDTNGQGVMDVWIVASP